MYEHPTASLDTSSDLKRMYNDLNSSAKYKCVYSFEHKLGDECSGHSHVVAFNCMNNVLSPLVITSTSDRRLCVVDCNSGQLISSLSATNGTFPHDRAAHCIALPQPSVHTTSAISPAEYNMFATNSQDGSIALYDIRTSEFVVAKYSSHSNRRENIRCHFSPCLRYLATGSEDRSIRILDLRIGFRELAKVSNIHADVVSDVCFSPLFPQLASASYDGTVKFFVE